MKYVSCVAFCAILLCCPVLRGQSVLTLSAADVKFLGGCGVLQDDIKVIPNLPRAGQLTLLGILRSDGRECSDLKVFKNTREYLRKFNLPPSECPLASNGSDTNFVTSAEAVRSKSGITLSADDVNFLSGCGVRQDDIQVIHNLSSAGQCKLLVILRKNGRVCGDLDIFKNCRDYLRKYTPPPSVCPIPPKGYDTDFLTKAEDDYINKIDNDLLKKLLQQMRNGR